MKNKKKIIVWIITILLTIFIAGCGGSKSELETPSVTLTTVEATHTLTPTLSPTATATEIVLPTVDVTQSPDKWDLSTVPDAQRVLIEKVLANPSEAGKEAQNAFDTLLISSWRSVLEKAGVPNAEHLADYALLDAIVDYSNAHGIHEVTLPFATHRLILTDPDNLVPFSQRPNVPLSTDAFYGLEQNSSSMSASDLREYSAFNFKAVNFYGENIIRTESDPPFTMTRFGSGARGDLVILVNLPGIDATKEQGAFLVLYDASGNRHYFETTIVYDVESETSSRDLCLIVRGNRNTVEQCQPGIKLGHTLKLIDQSHFTGNHPLTKQELIDFLIESGSHHAEIRTDNLGGKGSTQPENIWRNGVGTATAIAFIPTVFP